MLSHVDKVSQIQVPRVWQQKRRHNQSTIVETLRDISENPHQSLQIRAEKQRTSTGIAILNAFQFSEFIS